MEFVLLIYGKETTLGAMSEAEMGALMEDYRKFNAEAVAAGVLRAGERLHDVASAATQRVRDGEVLTTDGPFAETKEQLAGFYLLDCKDRDEALSWGSAIAGRAHRFGRSAPGDVVAHSRRARGFLTNRDRSGDTFKPRPE